MSFVWKRPEGRLKSPEQCAREILEVALSMNLDDFAAVLATMCVAQESDFWCPWNAKDPSSHNYPFDSESNDGRSVGYFQQQNGKAGDTVTGSDNWWGPMSQRMDLKKSAHEFLNRLEDNYHDADNSPISASHFIQNVQRSAYPDAYAKHWNRAWDLTDVAKNRPVAPQPQPGAPVTNRPDFNEIDQIGWDSADPHGSTRSRPPINWFIHTQEGDGNAETLASFLRSTSGAGAVSYHYTVHEDPNDHGVTVCDVIDTDLYSWSVLNANVFSINACFAGSRAAYSRDQWLAKYRNAIRVVAYLAVEDAKKYTGISTNVIVPPYNIKGPGISDHKYVTQALGIGNHTDVGNNFPWDVFVGDVNSFATPLEPTGPTAPPPVIDTTPIFAYPTTDLMTRQMWEQFFGPKGEGWPTLFGKTGDGKRGKYPVEALSDLHKEI